MTANKLKLAGAAAAVVLVGAAVLTVRQQGGDHPVPAGPAAQVPAAADAPAARPQPAKPSGARKNDKADKGGDKPLWRSLTPAQQVALQPLAGEWDAMDGVRKQKWLQLANRFAALGPEEQQRVHERMRAWVNLTPEQRELARETYTRTRKITPDQKNATWESYLQLPEDQKKKLAASASGRKPRVEPAQAGGKAGAPLGQGATACPAGTVKNAVSAVPPCVPAAPPPPSAPAPSQPPAGTQPAKPPVPEPEKQVPANWGITPNNA
jgi:hypothetical protein